MSLDQEAWAEIASLWLDGTEPLGRIAARFAISHQKITAHARREGWPLRGAPSKTVIAVDQDASGVGHDGVVADRDRNRRGAGQLSNRKMPAPLKGREIRSPKAGSSKDRAGARNAMVERLFDAMDIKLSAIEERIASGGDASSADSERTTRALNTLVRGLEKLSDYEGKISKRAERNDGNPRLDSDDPERRRNELAQRIERLLKRART